MASKGYKVTSLLICDEIRREESGKEIFIGVYNRTIIARSFPIKLPSLFVRLTCQVDHADFDGFELAMIDPKNRELARVEGKVRIEDANEPVAISVGFRDPTFSMEGNYVVRFGLDASPRKVGEFSVRLPRSETERNRLA